PRGAADSGELSPGNLPAPRYPLARSPGAWEDPGHRPDHRFRDADAARVSHCQLGRPDPRRTGRAAARPPAAGTLRLQGPEAGLRDAVLAVGIELPHRRPRRVPGPRHVVAGVSVAAAEQ